MYSDWAISSNMVQRNTLPTPPAFTATPAVYSGGQVTLNWSGAVAGTSALRRYIIQASESWNEGQSWSGWATWLTINSTETFGSRVVNVSTFPRSLTRFRIQVEDVLGGISDFVQSNNVMRNSPPLAPIVDTPRQNAATYSRRPFILIQTQAEPDGHQQSVWVNDWNSVEHPELFSTSGTSAAAIRTAFAFPADLPVGNSTVSIRCRDDELFGTAINRTFTIRQSPFENIVANQTHVKAAHIQTLRNAINTVRNFYNMANYSFPQASTITAGQTPVRDFPLHILELRAAVDEVIAHINLFCSTGGVPPITWLPIGSGRPRADVMVQLQGVILGL